VNEFAIDVHNTFKSLSSKNSTKKQKKRLLFKLLSLVGMEVPSLLGHVLSMSVHSTAEAEGLPLAISGLTRITNMSGNKRKRMKSEEVTVK
jgi:hypothetical protein